MYDLRVALSTGQLRRRRPSSWTAARTIPHARWVQAAEPRLVVPTQVDASTAGKTILVPGRLVGVDVAHGGPHVNSVSATAGRTLADAGRSGTGAWCSTRTSPSTTTCRPRRGPGERRRHARLRRAGALARVLHGHRRPRDAARGGELRRDVRPARDGAADRRPPGRGQRPRARRCGPARTLAVVRRELAQALARSGSRRSAPRSTAAAATPRTGCSTTTSRATSGSTTSSRS